MNKHLFMCLLMANCCLLSFAQLQSDSLLIEGRYRNFLYMARSAPKPGASLLFLMHGSGGRGSDMAKTATKLESISKKEKLVIVYPGGYQNYWNECRRYSTAVANKEDVNEQAFFNGMINYFDSLYKINRKKVFAAGMSGGGHMAYKLGLTMPGTFQAIAAIIANMPDSSSMDCVPAGKPLPVMIINGTLDETNPYNGGEMFVNKASFGVVKSTEKSFEYWWKLAGYQGSPVKKMLPDVDTADHKQIESYTFKWKGKPEVVLLKVIGGHHDYPNDVDVFLYIWQFFKRNGARL
jgi:polyhydroxybutyrate depolymerase